MQWFVKPPYNSAGFDSSCDNPSFYLFDGLIPGQGLPVYRAAFGLPYGGDNLGIAEKHSSSAGKSIPSVEDGAFGWVMSRMGYLFE